MRALPYGFPKVMVSTMASGNVAPWVDTKDITMMFSVTDIMGLNRSCGASSPTPPAPPAAWPTSRCLSRRERPLVGGHDRRDHHAGAMTAVEVLERAGYETIVFHAVGTGGRAMEELMREGLIGAVLDFSTIEVSNEMLHALLAADAERLTTAGRLGLPQVICPGAVEVLVFNEPHTVPAAYRAGRSSGTARRSPTCG